MVKNTIILLVLDFFQFYIISLLGKKIFRQTITNSQEPDPLKKNTRSRRRLEKKSGPEPVKNYPTPQPWLFHWNFLFGLSFDTKV